MTNVEMSLEDKQLVIRVNLTKEAGPSKSGRSIVIGSTGGSVPLPWSDAPPGTSINLTVYKDRQRSSENDSHLFRDPFP